MSVEIAEEPLQESRETDAQNAPTTPQNGRPVRIEPDLDFIRALRGHLSKRGPG